MQFDLGGFDFGGGGGEGRASFRDLFSQYFRGAAPAGAWTHAEPGADLEYQISIGFWESVRGTVKKLTVTRLNCPTCGGSGSSARRRSARYAAAPGT